MMIVAIALPAMVAFTGLAIDGSRVYDERRQMQNAADAAALGGTREFNDWLMNPQATVADIARVEEVVMDLAEQNGADPDQVVCKWIAKGDPSSPSAELGPCSDTSLAYSASGVRVWTGASKGTFFIKVVGADDFTATAKATAQVQRLVSLGQSVPFLVCSQGVASDGGDDVELLAQDADLNWSINPAAYNREFEIHGPQINDCGLQGNSFKGLAGDGNERGTIPGEWVADNGTHAGPTRQELGTLGGCDGTLDSCVLLLPICPTSNSGHPGGDGRLQCTQMGLFEVEADGANRHVGRLIQKPIVLPQGAGGDLPVGQNEARVVRLVD